MKYTVTWAALGKLMSVRWNHLGGYSGLVLLCEQKDHPCFNGLNV